MRKYFQSLLLLLATTIALIGTIAAAPGVREFRNGQFWPVPFYAKKVVILQKVVKDDKGIPYDGFATISWEIDDRGEVAEPPAKPGDPQGPIRGTYGHTALVAIYIPDVKKLTDPAHPRGEIAFLPPQLIEYAGDKLYPGGCVSCPNQYENDLAVDDIDADGQPDLLILNAYGQGIGIFLNKGSGRYGNDPDIKLGTTWTDLEDLEKYVGRGVVERPYQLAVGNFAGNGRRDIAIQYINDDRMMIAVLNQEEDLKTYTLGNKFTNYFERSGCFLCPEITGTIEGPPPTPYGFTPENDSDTPIAIKYKHNSPFYSIEDGRVFQMMSATLGTVSRDLLFFSLNGIQIWDPTHNWITNVTGNRGLYTYLPFASQPFTVNKDVSSGLVDLVFNGGFNIAPGSFMAANNPPITLSNRPRSGHLEHIDGVVSADFDIDGKIDLAQVIGGVPAAKIAGTHLVIGYGDGTVGSPLIPVGMPEGSGLKINDHHTVVPRWWGNPLSMAIGNFTGNYAHDPVTGATDLTKGYSDIITLGSDWVTIHVNLGDTPDQLSTLLLDSIGSDNRHPGESVTAFGNFQIGTFSEVKSIVFEGIAGTPTEGIIGIVPAAAMKLAKGPTDRAELALPLNLKAGQYEVYVQNLGGPSKQSLKKPYNVTP